MSDQKWNCEFHCQHLVGQENPMASSVFQPFPRWKSVNLFSMAADVWTLRGCIRSDIWLLVATNWLWRLAWDCLKTNSMIILTFRINGPINVFFSVSSFILKKKKKTQPDVSATPVDPLLNYIFCITAMKSNSGSRKRRFFHSFSVKLPCSRCLHRRFEICHVLWAELISCQNSIWAKRPIMAYIMPRLFDWTGKRAAAATENSSLDESYTLP